MTNDERYEVLVESVRRQSLKVRLRSFLLDLLEG